MQQRLSSLSKRDGRLIIGFLQSASIIRLQMQSSAIIPPYLRRRPSKPKTEKYGHPYVEQCAELNQIFWYGQPPPNPCTHAQLIGLKWPSSAVDATIMAQTAASGWAWDWAVIGQYPQWHQTDGWTDPRPPQACGACYRHGIGLPWP